MSTEQHRQTIENLVPWYEKETPEFKALIYTNASQISEMDKNITRIEDNLLIGSADFTLPILEKDFNIITPVGFPDVLRREQIIAKSRSAFSQTTEQSIIDVAESFANGAIDLQTTETLGLYSVTFVSQLGAPYNIEALKIAIRNILPAHLQVEYIFIYNTWNWATKYQWGQPSSITWHGFKILEEGGL